MTKPTVFENRFALKQRLFSEGNQAAYAAHDRTREENVLLFLVPPAGKLTPEMNRAVRADIERAFSVNAPSLLPVLDLREMGEYRFLVMPRPRGENAWARITQEKTGTKGLSPEQALRAADDLIAAAEAAHAHGTILGCSPKQVWIDVDGGAQVQYYWLERVYLGGDESVPVPEGGFKTAGVEGGYFHAPELGKGRAGAAPPADQFFIAAVLYGLLRGEVPSGTLAPIRRGRKDVPRPLAAAIEKGLAPEPAARHKDLASMRRAMHRQPAKLTALLPLLLLLLGLWAGWAIFQAGANVEDYAFPAEVEARRAATFAASRPVARPVPAPDEAALARYPGHYTSTDGTTGTPEHVLEVRPDGSFLESDFTKDVVRHTRGLWWHDANSTRMELTRMRGGGKRPVRWQASVEPDGLVLHFGGGATATLSKVGRFADDGGAPVPLIELDAPLAGAVLADLDVPVRGRVAVPRTVLRVNGATVPVVGTRFDTVVKAAGGGDFEVAVEATAPDGFVSRLSRTVRVDREPPQVQATAILERIDGIWRLKVAGRAADDQGLAALSVNDEPVLFDGGGSFSYERAGADAVAHAFVEIVAVDGVGRLTRRLSWPAVTSTSDEFLAPQFLVTLEMLEAGQTDAAEDALRTIRRAGGLIEQLGPDKLARLARGDRPPRVSLDDYPRPPAWFIDADGTREITLSGVLDWHGPDDVLMVGGRKFDLEDGRFEAQVQLPRLGPNTIPFQVLRGGEPVFKRDVEVRLAGGDGDVPSWTGVEVSEEQREASARYGLAIGRTNRWGMRFALVPPGAAFARPYYLQVGEVTREQFAQLETRALPRVYTAPSGEIPLALEGGPATDVTHTEAVAFARKLSGEEGGRYRLPTDAEWEHAARAGDSRGDTYWQGDPSKVADFANVADRSIKRKAQGWPDRLLGDHDDGAPGTWPVNRGTANRWGLRNMLGNAGEWVVEASGGAASRAPVVYRGGGFRKPPAEVRFSARWSMKPGDKAIDVGFRLLLEAEVR